MSLYRQAFLGSCLLFFALAPAPGAALAQPATFAPLVKQQRDKVVHISTSGKTGESTPGGRLMPFRFPEPRRGMGSGFIISREGLIVTNHHVVADSQSIQVVLASGKKYEATVIGVDARTDLALIRIEGKNLPAVQFGDSNATEVGDWVLAIGNPFGLDFSVAAGIVSAKGRNIFDVDNLAYGEFIQTDAAINPGNSGGPLFNIKGQVIGVNTAISARGHGIGFAVPSNLVVEVVRQLRKHGKVMRGWLGVVIQEVTGEVAQSIGLPGRARGVLVEEVLPEAPAFAAGIRPGDVLTLFGEAPLRKVTQLQKLVAFSGPGSPVKMTGLRRSPTGGKWEEVRFQVRMGSPPTAARGTPVLQQVGLSVGTPPEELRRKLGLQPGVGVLVEGVTPRGTAEGTGLREGDVILEADRRPVGSPAELGRILAGARDNRVPLLVKRDQQVLYLVLSRRRQ